MLVYFIVAALATGEMVVDSDSYPSGKAILTARNEPGEFAYQLVKRLLILLIAAGYFYVRGSIWLRRNDSAREAFDKELDGVDASASKTGNAAAWILAVLLALLALLAIVAILLAK